MGYDPGDRSDVRHPLHPESDSLYGCGAKLLLALIILFFIVVVIVIVM